jgi:hypothetical protein
LHKGEFMGFGLVLLKWLDPWLVLHWCLPVLEVLQLQPRLFLSLFVGHGNMDQRCKLASIASALAFAPPGRRSCRKSRAPRGPDDTFCQLVSSTSQSPSSALSLLLAEGFKDNFLENLYDFF